MSPPVALVLFDMEGVLSHYDRDARVARLTALTGVAPDTVRHAIWGSGLEARADAGEIDAQTYLEALGDLLGYPVTRDEWLDSRRASITPNAATIELAARLAKRHRIAVLTNNGSLVTDHVDLLYPAVAQVFGTQVYPSAAFGATKPAARTYLGCVEKLGVAPGATLFIDDTDANVQGAIDAGLQGHRFVTADAFAAELVRRGLLA